MPKNDHDFIVSRHDRKPSMVWDELHASTTEQAIHPRIHDPLISAIQHKQFVTLKLKEHKEVFAEPHIYGLRAGRPTLLVYDEQTDPAWRFIDVGQIEEVKTWPNHFAKRDLPTSLDPDKN
jgi:hypothetical protein